MSSLPPEWRVRADALAERGLNALGVADGTPWQDWLPGCRSVVVLGSGGPVLWQALLAELERDPSALAGQAHPVDRFVRRSVQAVDPTPPPTRRWAYADLDQAEPLPIQRLALQAGLGWTSRLQLVLHPEFGPWMGLRAACFTTEALPLDGPLPGDGPCATCAAPCKAACPGRAMRGERLDWRWCTVHRGRTDDCLDACHARSACPEGAAWRYPELEHAYHHDKARGRRRLAATLGVHDPRPPAGADWVALARQALALLGRGGS